MTVETTAEVKCPMCSNGCELCGWRGMLPVLRIDTSQEAGDQLSAEDTQTVIDLLHNPREATPALKRALRPDEEFLVARCKVTGNIVGTDTWQVINGRAVECPCSACQKYMNWMKLS